MEDLGITQFSDCFRSRRVLITGHTGFKGSWLALWLHQMGATVTGISLDPETSPSHWSILNLPIVDLRCDVRDFAALRDTISAAEPEVVFHLAAQSLVRRSYFSPLETWSTNVMGTANVIEAARSQSTVRAVIVVTTDKCYENQERSLGYRESDRLGGHDPYSASKASAELVAASYRQSFCSDESAPLLATARSGNVIGGGDWSADRLIPDLIRTIEKRSSLEIRSPTATRPWQHVLDSLSGYLILGQRLLDGDRDCATAWNFGPESTDHRSVAEVMGILGQIWPASRWHLTKRAQPHESTLLHLDSSKARRALEWRSVWDLTTAVEKTAEWYQAWLARRYVSSREQLASYVRDAERVGLGWARR